MKFTKIAAIAVCGALMLTGCGKKAENNNTQKAALPDTAVMTVGDVEVSNGIFNFFFNSYNSQLDDADSSSDKAIEECESGYLRVAVAKAMGIELDDETKSEMENQKNQVKASYGDNYQSFLDENSLTEDDIDTIISFGYYSEALQDKVEDVEYTDEMKRDYFKNHYRRAKHVLIMIDDETDDAAAKAKAEEVLEKAQGGENFDELIAEYGEDPGMSSNPDGYVFTDGTMVQEFQDGVDSLKPGEFTMVKTTYGYHVIERLDLEETPDYFEDAYASVSDELEEKMEDGLFEDQLKKWAEEYNIETKVNDDIVNEIINIATK